MSEAVALFDLDGTMADFDRSMTEKMRAIQAPGEPEFANEGNQDDRPAYMTARWRMIKSQPGFWRDLPRFQLGFDVFDVAADIGFSPYVLTKAPKLPRAAFTEKAEWVDRHLPGTPIIMSDDEGLVYGKVLVDDWPPCVHRWLQWRSRGLVVMPAHYWNAGYSHPNAIRYTGTNLTEVRERLQRAYERRGGEEG